MTSSFDWNDITDDVVVPEQPAVAIYTNPNGAVVIRQAGQFGPDEDHWVYFHPQHAVAIAYAILDQAAVPMQIVERPAGPAAPELVENIPEVPKARRARIKAALRDDPSRSNRAIAKELGVDHKTVGKVRGELSGEFPAPAGEPDKEDAPLLAAE